MILNCRVVLTLQSSLTTIIKNCLKINPHYRLRFKYSYQQRSERSFSRMGAIENIPSIPESSGTFTLIPNPAFNRGTPPQIGLTS